MTRIDTYKPKPMYGQWLMELAPSHTDPLNELGRLWANGQPATAFALAQAVKSAEAHRAGSGKWDRPKYHSVVIKLSNMLARRGRMGTLAMVNPRRKKRKNPSAGKRRSAAKKRIAARYKAMFNRAKKGALVDLKLAKMSRTTKAGRTAFHRMLKKLYPKKRTVNTNPSAGKRRAAARKRMASRYRKMTKTAFQSSSWASTGGRYLLGKRAKLHRMAVRSGAGRKLVTRGSVRMLKNPSAAWNKARKASRRKWIKDRFGYATHRSNPPRSARTGRFIRRGRK